MSLRTITSLGMMLVSAVIPAREAPAASDGTSAHSFEFTSIDGERMPMSGFAGKTVLLVNTASKCGFTPQYEGLQGLYETYKDQGLVVLGVPSNDFGNQEPGEEAQIENFCEVNFGVTFPMTEKVHVTGEQAHPLYAWIVDALGPAAKPRWNFHKILIGPDGRPRDAWPSTTTPGSTKLRARIESVLTETPSG
jgi:glutathione peroxidase